MQITIRNYLQEITEVLRKKKIIELSLYNEVNDPQSSELPDTKAKVVPKIRENGYCCNAGYSNFLRYIIGYTDKHVLQQEDSC